MSLQCGLCGQPRIAHHGVWVCHSCDLIPEPADDDAEATDG